MDQRDEWKVLLVSRGARESRPTLEDFLPHQQQFIQALNAIWEGNELVSLTLNGRGVIGATNDHRARILANDALVNGARVGLSGSGTAIVIVIPVQLEGVIKRIKAWYAQKHPDFEIINALSSILKKKMLRNKAQVLEDESVGWIESNEDAPWETLSLTLLGRAMATWLAHYSKVFCGFGHR